MTRDAVNPAGSPAVGPYSAAVCSGTTLFCSGQTPIDPDTGALVQGGVAEQTRQCFTNLFTVLRARQLDSRAVVKVNVFLTDMGDFDAMNQEYERMFAEPYPARTTIGVAALPLGARIEIELIAETN